MAYCTKADVEMFMGKSGVDLRLDDLGNSTTAFARILSYVDGRMNRYLSQMYDVTTLAGNDWCRDRAVILAVNYLAQRRGNPALMRDEVAQIEEELKDIRAGNTYIPGAKVLAQMIPSVRTQEVHHGYLIGPELLIDPRLSTGGGYPDEQFGPGPGL